jgi:hypothetical protein
MVEDSFSLDVVEEIIERSNVASAGTLINS